MDVIDTILRTDFTTRPSTSTPPANTPNIAGSPGAATSAASDFATQVNLASSTPNSPTVPATAATTAAALVDATRLEIYTGVLLQPSALPTNEPQLPVLVTETIAPQAATTTPDSVATTTTVSATEEQDASSPEEVANPVDVGTISVLAAISQSLAVQPVSITVPKSDLPGANVETATGDDGQSPSAVNQSTLAADRLTLEAKLPPADLARSVVRSLQETAYVPTGDEVLPTAVPVAAPVIERPSASAVPTTPVSQVATTGEANPSVTPTAVELVEAATSPVAIGQAVAETASRAAVVTQSADNETQQTREDDPSSAPLTVPPQRVSAAEETTESAANHSANAAPSSRGPSSTHEDEAPRMSEHHRHGVTEASVGSQTVQQATTAATSRPIAATISPQDPHQLVEQLSQLVLESHDRGEQLVARVSPPDMGTIVIDVQSQGGDVVVRMEASSSDAQQLLVEHLPQLHETLNHLGLSTERIEIVRTDTSAVQESGLSANVGDQGTQQSTSQQQSEAERQRQLELENARRQRPANGVNAPATFQRLQELNVRI